MQKEINWLLKEKYKGKKPKGHPDAFYNDVKRLEAGEPLDYVIGFTEFGAPLGPCKIDLSKKPLIPRPETEFWAAKAIKDIKSSKGGIKCLDIFSGSGCIGIAVLKNIKNARCDFADKDKKAIEQITINCKLNNINPKRYKIIRSDVFSRIPGKYQYIFANPPYVALKRKNKLQKSVLEYEPKLALMAGRDGLLHIRKFLKQAKSRLNKGGRIYMEFGPEQKKEIKDLIKKSGYADCQFNRDQHGKWRYVVIR